MVVDDARIVDEGACQVETWRRFNRDSKETWGTVGVSENIIEASWEALVDSVEYILYRKNCKKTGRTPGNKLDKSKV